MKLRELFSQFDPKQKVFLTSKDAPTWDGIIACCPSDLLDYEVSMARASSSITLWVCIKRPQPSAVTWRQLAAAIESMPNWAQDEPATLWVEDAKKVHSDENYGISNIITYLGKEPSEVENEEDFVFAVLGDIIY